MRAYVSNVPCPVCGDTRRELDGGVRCIACGKLLPQELNGLFTSAEDTAFLHDLRVCVHVGAGVAK